MTVGKILDVGYYTMNTPSGDFSISVTDQEIDLLVVSEIENIIINLKFTNHLASVFVTLTGFLV